MTIKEKDRQQPLRQNTAQQQQFTEIPQTINSSIENILENITDAFVLIDKEWRFTYVNQAAIQLIGKPHDKILGQMSWDLFPETQESRLYTELHRAMEESGPVHFEVLYFPSALWYECDAYPSPEGLSVFFRDITKHKQVERQLQERLEESEERFRIMAETIPNIIFISLPDGSRDYTNSRFYEHTQLSPELAKGFGWLEVLHPDDREKTKTRWLHAMESGEPLEIQYRIRNAKGSYHWFQGRAYPIHDKTGQITKWFGACSNIDDLIRAQESLQESDRAKDEFLAMLGHELRNPLVPIGNAVELMRLHPDKRAIQSKGINIIDRQVKHLTHLVNELLNAARILTREITLNIELVDLKEVVMRAIETIQPAIETASHELTLSLPNQQLNIEGDPARLIQVVANLLDNAVKYTLPGGHIHLQIEQQQDNAVIRVRDNGIGFPPEKLPTIFDVFAQINPSLDRAQGGLGLGLALVRRLTEMHGGKATAFSEGQGQGSEFTITLPLMLKTTSWNMPPPAQDIKRNPG